MTTDTKAAVAAVLMQAADAFAEDDNLSHRICCNGQDCGCQGATAADYVQHQLRALIPAPAMAALEAERAEARKVKPLVWEESLKGRWIGAPAVKLGDLAFWVFQVHDGYMRHVIGQGRVVYRTIEAAKAAAQADYEARILSALDKP